MTPVKSYTELSKLKTFEERFRYLKLDGSVGEDTFGYDRYLNQVLYHSDEWRRARNYVITRDNGCDLGIPDHKIMDELILVHHINPITKEDILNRSKILFDPEYLITTVKRTHNALHYGDESILNKETIVERSANDMCPWKRIGG